MGSTVDRPLFRVGHYVSGSHNGGEVAMRSFFPEVNEWAETEEEITSVRGAIDTAEMLREEAIIANAAALDAWKAKNSILWASPKPPAEE